MAFSIASLLCVLAAPSLGDDRPWEQARWHALNAQFSSNGEDSSAGQRWLESQLHTEERHGFEYSQSLRLDSDKKFVFSIQGPLIGEWAHGLAFELRF
jgi:hypothetical protein